MKGPMSKRERNDRARAGNLSWLRVPLSGLDSVTGRDYVTMIKGREINRNARRVKIHDEIFILG
jgi:hypothetical protein